MSKRIIVALIILTSLSCTDSTWTIAFVPIKENGHPTYSFKSFKDCEVARMKVNENSQLPIWTKCGRKLIKPMEVTE